MTQNILSKSCSKCGQEKPHSDFCLRKKSKDGLNWWCKSCSADYLRSWKLSNPDKKLEANKRWREENPEKVKASSAKWYSSNSEKSLIYSKLWYEANKEKAKQYWEENKEEILAKQRAHYEANKDKHKAKQKAYHEANKEQKNAKRREKALLATDSYLRSLSKTPLPPELVEAVRLKLFIKRKVLEIKNETHQ
jgi:hypothetical protein